MATQPLGEGNQQVWDEALSRILNLSRVTVKRNVELENMVAKLQAEIELWKDHHATMQMEANAHKVQLATLNKQVSNMDVFRGSQDPLILCVINGSASMFCTSLLSQGFRGGNEAAKQLTKVIAEYLANESVQVVRGLSFWVTVYFNKSEVLSTLLGHELCTEEQFESFLAGFSHASPRFMVVDVGYNTEDVTMKIREYLQTYAKLPLTLRMFFGGVQERDITSLLDDLAKEHLLGKLVTLKSAGDSGIPPTFFLPSLQEDNLFFNMNSLRTIQKPSPGPLTVGPFSSVITNGGLISPQSPERPIGTRLIDPSLPLHKQSPPPCNEHYLMTCSKGIAVCKYSHDYILTPEQLATLASNAKKAPCNWLKNGLPCPYGESCCWGHVCPNGPKCFHLSKGKCWFKGESMHSPSSPRA
ncbi:hypothetical protein F5146DRAFT_1046043 [Armillaria mellea]|nr:hypothetical protein F5146DRAFT_1046043 [Armillaria mellea]